MAEKSPGTVIKSKCKIIETLDPFRGEKATIYKYKSHIKEGEKVLEVPIQTFSKTIADYFDSIKGQTEAIDIEYEKSQREYQGNIYIDRTVKQAWKPDGSEVRTQEKKGYGGYRAADDSPEKRTSIEMQSICSLVVQRQIAGIEQPKQLVKLADTCMESALKNYMLMRIPKAEQKESTPKEEKKTEAKEKPASKESVQPSTEMKTVGNLFQSAKALFNYSPGDVLQILNVETKEEIEVDDIQDAWTAVQAAYYADQEDAEVEPEDLPF